MNPHQDRNRTVNQELHRTHRLQNTVIINGGTQKVQIMLPYNEKQGNKLLSKMNKYLNKSLPTEVKTAVTYQSKKLGTKFELKDKTTFHQQNNLAYYIRVPIKHVMITLAKQIKELRKELSTTTKVTKIRIC